MAQLNKRGVTYLVVVLFLAIVGISAAGWYVYKKRADDSATSNNQIDSFEKCVAAGNPVQESYPEVCRASGKSFTNPKQTSTPAPTEADETSKWLLFTPTDKAYSVRVPDGWQAVSLYNNLYVRDASKLKYLTGTVATVENLSEGGWDGDSPFNLINPGAYYDQIVREGTEQGTVTTTTGLIAHKYVYEQTTEPEAIGHQKGAKVYHYYFDSPGKYIQISHVVNPGDADQHELVEKLLKTLSVN